MRFGSFHAPRLQEPKTAEIFVTYVQPRIVLGFISMSAVRVIKTALVRGGDDRALSDDWAGTTIAQRIDAVWKLTQQCLLWNRASSDELRLQRSHCRVQRTRR